MNIKGYGKATQDMIDSFEKHVGFLLPDDYKQFLCEYNGGSARYNYFWVDDLDVELPLHVLYGLGLDKNLDLKTWNDEYIDDLFSNSVIIGHDPGSGLIVLINDNEDGGIYYWDHTFNFEQSSEDENTYKIADTFQDFINGLKTP